jgi:thiol-disulfide isomerase/thioredoxin
VKRIWAAVLVLVIAGCSRDDIELADGSFTSSSHWEGRWILINYWAEWCAPCRAEIPELNDLHAERVDHGIVVLGVNYDGLIGKPLTDLMDEMGVEFPVLAVDPKIRYGYELPVVLPTTMVIHPDGSIAATLTGPQTAATLLAAVEKEADH